MPWKAFGPLLHIINRLLDWLEQYKRGQDYEQRQEKRDEASTDPGSAFRDHFGMRDNKSDASEADKANAGRSDKSG